MNIHHCCTLRNLILAAVLGIGFAPPVLAQQHALFVDLNSKEVTDLGTLGGYYSIASAIHDAGQVVGRSYTAANREHHQERALFVDLNSKEATDLGTLGGIFSWATAINDAGQVVGRAHTDNDTGLTHAFITGANGAGMIDLGSVETTARLTGSTTRGRW